MRILYMESDSAAARSLEVTLKSEDFIVSLTDLEEEGVDLRKLSDHDLIIVGDVTGVLPNDVVTDLRLAKVKTPILILSDRAGIEDKVRGFAVGADDYVTKPFHKDELVARIHAIIRRSQGRVHSVIQVGDLSVNLDTKTVEVGGQRVHLTGKEYQVLELLCLRRGTALTRAILFNHLYDGTHKPGLKIISVFLTKLRKKLADASDGRRYIKTVSGHGYVLCESGNDSRRQSA